jgi:pyruvate-formate lyase-activating enzyme
LKHPLDLVVAGRDGRVRVEPSLRPAGMKAGHFFPLEDASLVPVPRSSELFLLPGRSPVGFPRGGGAAVALDGVSAVAAFIPPGYSLTHSAAFREDPGARQLPLFAYGACVHSNGKFFVAAFRVDRGARHDERALDMRRVERGVAAYRRRFPGNRLVGHLEGCAVVNGCANAKNFFLGRYEAPVPTAAVCNAQCQGCISLQPDGRDFPATQKRISFAPTPEEIAELALAHFERERDPIVSFGQGCEGEPTLMAETIERAIRLIRARTPKGLLNVNTNGSRPKAIGRLFAAGLTNVRISLNSAREPYYSRYYQPKGYSLEDVAESVRVAKRCGGFVSLNYLSMPGFTDTEGEVDALRRFVSGNGVDMVQWRNLNYDPLRYFAELDVHPGASELLGMREAVARLARAVPGTLAGYFNPSKSTLRRRLSKHSNQG